MARHTIVLPLLTGVLCVAGCHVPSPAPLDDNVAAMQMLKQLALGCHSYAQDNDGLLPRSLAELTPYVDAPFDPAAYELVASGRLADVERPAEAILIRQREPMPDGRHAAAFVDGHAGIFAAERR